MLDQPYTGSQSGVVPATTLGKVMTLLGVAAAFTAAGAAVGPAFGRWGTLLGVLGGLVCVIVLGFVKERRPLNLILLCAFATFEGIFLGGVVDAYIRGGLGLIVLDAAAITAGVTVVAGAYGYTTKRDLTGLGNVLFIGLLAVIGASLLGLFLHLTLLYIAISAATAVLFTGFLIFDLNRVARAGEVSTGDAILLAVSVYLDILNLFLALLRLLSEARR
jgi:FtsH-binding integral membrane protein